jgi:hypothetical protein
VHAVAFSNLQIDERELKPTPCEKGQNRVPTATCLLEPSPTHEQPVRFDLFPTLTLALALRYGSSIDAKTVDLSFSVQLLYRYPFHHRSKVHENHS